MKFSTNIIVVVVVTILLVLLYKYWSRTTTEYYVTNDHDIKKKVLNYIGYSNIYMREINKVNNIKDLRALRISHNKLIEKIFIIKETWSLFEKQGIFLNILQMRNMKNYDFGFYAGVSSPEAITNLKRLIISAVLRIQKINKMIDDKMQSLLKVPIGSIKNIIMRK